MGLPSGPVKRTCVEILQAKVGLGGILGRCIVGQLECQRKLVDARLEAESAIRVPAVKRDLLEYLLLTLGADNPYHPRVGIV